MDANKKEFTHKACVVLDDIYGEDSSREENLISSFNGAVAQKILTQRKKLGITQEVLAKKSGVNRITICAIEKQKRIVSTEVLLKLLDALDLKIYFAE